MSGFSFVLPMLLAAGVTLEAETWPGFRGRGDSISPAKKLPTHWSPKENIAWKVGLPGYGQSCPIVWKDKVFVTAVAGEQREKGFVLAYDANTGKKLWAHEFEPSQKAKWAYTISRAAPTPVVDADAVYAFFEGGDLLALTHDGKQLWSRSLVKEYGEFNGNHGMASSPTQTRDALIVLIDHSGPSYLLAVDKKTGKNRWKTARKSRGSWASPVIAKRNGQPEIVVSSNGSVAGYEVATGKLLWEMEGLEGNTIPSASASGNVVLVGSGIRKGGDAKNVAKSNCCIKLVEKDGKPSYEVTWATAKASASYATPLAYRGHAYFVTQTGIVYCIDMQSGKEVYAERIDGPCWASPIGAGEHIFFFGKDGRTTVAKAGPTFEKVSSNELWVEAKNTDKKEPRDTKSTGGDAGDAVVYGVAAVEGTIFVQQLRRFIELLSDSPTSWLLRCDNTATVRGISQIPLRLSNEFRQDNYCGMSIVTRS